jgi:hypothetical protein
MHFTHLCTPRARLDRSILRRIVLVLLGTLVLALLTANLGGCATVSQPPADGCHSVDWTPAKVHADAQKIPGIRQHVLTADERQRFLRAWNDVPPVGGFQYDTIIAYEAPGHPNVVLVFIERGCVWSVDAAPREAFRRAIASGTGA